MVRADPPLAHPWGSSLPPPAPHPHGSRPARPRHGSGQHPSAPRPGQRDRAVGKALADEGSMCSRLWVPVGALEEIQVLLVPLLEALQKDSVLCPRQLQRLHLPGTRGEAPCAAQGTELPQQHLLAAAFSGQAASSSLPRPPTDAIGSRRGPCSCPCLTPAPPSSRRWSSPGSPALPHGPGHGAALPDSPSYPRGAGQREPPASSHAARPGLGTLPTGTERQDPSASGAFWWGHLPPKAGTCLACSCALAVLTCAGTGTLSGR